VENQRMKKKNIWSVPIACCGLIAIVSFFTTGQGMSDTFFQSSFIAAIAVSSVIQLLLAWLNQMLPKLTYKKNIRTRLFIWAVYVFVGMWSIGFSFVYLCNHAYDTIYMRDDQDLLTDTYRKEKIDLEQLASMDFTEKLQEVTNLIGELQALAGVIDISTNEAVQDVVPDFQKLKEYFRENAQMITVIQKCENASEGKILGDSTKIEEIVTAALANAVAEREIIQKEYNDLELQISNCNTRIHDISLDIYPLATKSKAFKSLEAEKDLEIKRRETLLIEQSAKQLDINKKDDEVKEINALKNYIWVKANTAESILSSKFAQILAELGSTSPNVNNANVLADEICTELISTMQEDGGNLKYTEILEGNLKLQELFRELNQIRSVQIYCSESASDTDICRTTEQWVGLFPTSEEKEQWRNSWNDEFVVLKSNIYKLPSASNPDVMKTYEKLSDMQRNILTELNQVERAVYYLTSSHRILALISLLLAILLDTIPVLFMIIKQKSSKIEPQPVPQAIFEG